MKRLSYIVTLLIIVAVSAAVAQDATAGDPAHIKVVFENDQLRVLWYNYQPGEISPPHAHPANLIIPVTPLDSKSTVDGKVTIVHLKAREVVWRGPTEHIFENIGSAPAEGFFVELKRQPAAPGSATGK